MLFPAKINIIFGISTSNNVGISKIYADKQVALHSLTFTKKSLSDPFQGQSSKNSISLHVVPFFGQSMFCSQHIATHTNQTSMSKCMWVYCQKSKKGHLRTPIKVKFLKIPQVLQGVGQIMLCSVSQCTPMERAHQM